MNDPNTVNLSSLYSTPQQGNQNAVNIDSGLRQNDNSASFETEALEIKALEDKLSGATCPQDLKDRSMYLLARLKRMQRTGTFSTEYDMISNYIDWITKFPWSKKCEEVLEISRVKQVLDSHHYGLEQVKQKIYQYMSVRILLAQKKDFEALKRSPVLCMVGLQGIGKTTIARSIAEALNRPFYRVSMGAIGSVLEIRGRNKGIEGAEPGQIVKAIVSTGVVNPVILLDELDKASGQAGLLADVMATMLEILDPEQNTKFRDHFVDYPIDLSEVMFIVSANKSGTFSAALLDRMEVIKMPAYTDQEKLVIARDYLLPRVRKTTGILEDQLTFREDVWPLILRPLGFDSGIRSLQRILENIAQKSALEIVQGKLQKVEITPQNFKDYLPKY
jgi:ATP-dependent Lon protease